MTKIREPLTIEKILQDVIVKLKENEIKDFTGKSVSHFRKCSDPNDKDHNLHLTDAIKLDILSLKSQNFTKNELSEVCEKKIKKNDITMKTRIGNFHLDFT